MTISDGGEGKEVPLTTELIDGTKRVIGTAFVRLVNGDIVVDAVITDPEATYLCRPCRNEYWTVPYSFSIREEPKKPQMRFRNDDGPWSPWRDAEKD